MLCWVVLIFGCQSFQFVLCGTDCLSRIEQEIVWVVVKGRVCQHADNSDNFDVCGSAMHDVDFFVLETSKVS